MGMSAAEHSKCVSIFEYNEEEMNEHPLALENGNADTGVRKKCLVADILHTSWTAELKSLLASCEMR